MKCPKCKNVEMVAHTHEGVEVDRCTGCGGVWLDPGEITAVLNQQLGPLIEQGEVTELGEDPRLSRRPATCARCGVAMMPMTGLADVTFDYCAGCRSMFLDAGELTVLHRYQGDSAGS
jgi:Zn-finger nucleic acid-binding protein